MDSGDGVGECTDDQSEDVGGSAEFEADTTGGEKRNGKIPTDGGNEKRTKTTSGIVA